ncbi:MAG: glycerol-3-phosphate responsive antiterminator, partial [Oscillospiraceae bacterium]|nr:glycerol-3-phosphate responsive antiterminator [Oscillospiraceae bacterium]
MRPYDLQQLLEEKPVIAAIKSDEGLEDCLQVDCPVVFVLYGTVNTIPAITEKLCAAGKTPLVHLDLLDGLSAAPAAVDYLARHTSAAGVISTKNACIRYAKEQGLITVQRFFLLDSLALENVKKADAQNHADMIEILPGVMPKIVRTLTCTLRCPIIAGGLIRDKEDVVTA